MNIQINPELQNFANTKVTAGIFSTIDEVINAALKKMQADEEQAYLFSKKLDEIWEQTSKEEWFGLDEVISFLKD